MYITAKPDPDLTKFDEIPWYKLKFENLQDSDNRDHWLKEHNLDDAKRAQLSRYIKAQQK